MAARKSTLPRKLSILGRPTPEMLLVEIVEGDEGGLYTISPCVPFSGAGRSWLWQGMGKKSCSRYEVAVIGDGADEGHCDCKGHRRWGHCRHMSAILKLLAMGKLESAPTPGRT